MENIEIAQKLEDVADMLEVKGANWFRVRAYRNAARTVRSYQTPIKELVAEDADLTELPDVGDDIAGYIRELVETGGLELRQQLQNEVPESLTDLTRIEGLGPERTKTLWQELGVESVGALEAAAEAGRVAELDGFGDKTQDNILRDIENYRERQGRIKLVDADQYAEPLVEFLRSQEGAERVEVAGSYRRRKATVGDLDVLVSAEDSGRITHMLTEFWGVSEVMSRGDTRASVEISDALQVDLRVISEKAYGAALIYFTGSKQHNIDLRTRALDQGYTLSEYGLFKGTDADANDVASDAWVAGRSEEEIYDALGLVWIPPELREANGELDAAAEDNLPDLITEDDLRGDLHMHTDWSDGADTLQTMVDAARERGYAYLAITDHSQALRMTGGLDEEKLEKQWAAMDELNTDGIRLLRGLEVDILRDGSLDLGEGWLEHLHLVVASVHSHLDLDVSDQTKRLLSAITHPQVDIIGHPTGRILGRRDASDLAWDEIFAAAHEHNVALEHNSSPDRLDLRDDLLRRAKDAGVKLVINSDAHRADHMRFVGFGVEQARRGWLTTEDVINSWVPTSLFDWLGLS